MYKKQKGQGALEYLLLIGGAIVVAVIVVTLLLGVGGESGSQSESTAYSLAVKNYMATSGIAYWRLNETGGLTAEDSHEYNLDGTLSGTTSLAFTESGRFGGGLSADALTGSYVNVPASSRFIPNNGVTMAAWVKPTAIQGSTQYIIYAGNEYQLRIDATTGRLRGGITNTDGVTTVTSYCVVNTAIPTGEWSFVATTFDTSTKAIKCYVFNGENVYTGTGIATYDQINNANSQVRLIGGSSGSKMVGTMDEAMIFNRELTQSELNVLARG